MSNILKLKRKDGLEVKAELKELNISYLDKELNRQVAEGEVLEVTEERGKVLTTNQFNNVFYCSVVEEAKEEKPPVKRKRK